VSTTERPPAVAHDWPLEQAARLAVEKQHCTRQTTGRELRLGWAQAGRILDALEVAEVVGPDRGDEAGTRDVLVKPEELDDALEHIRANARHLRGNPILADQGESPDKSVHNQMVDEPGAEVAVRDEGELAEVVDAELVPRPEPEPVTLIGTIVHRPAEAWERLREQPAVQTTVTVGRPPLRYAWMVGQGWMSWAHRAVQGATHGHLREQVRQARAAGDRAALGEWTERLQVARDARMKRLLMLPAAVGAGLRLCVIGLLLVGAALLVGGVAVWWGDGGWTWDDWWAGIGRTLDAAGTLLGWAVWLAMWMAPVALMLGGHREGELRGHLPRVFTTEDERAEMDSVIDERMIARALANVGIAALTRFFKEGGQLDFTHYPRVDGEGSYAQVRLPDGVGAEEVAEPKPRRRLAGTLGRSALECWPTKADEESLLDLWVADKGKLNAGAGEWPLLMDGVVDAFEGVPCGKSQRGDVIPAPVFEVNWLIGGRPGQGKSAFLRCLLLGCALDPTVEMWTFVFGESPDFDPFEPRLARYAMGMDESVFERATQALRDALAEMERRGKVLGQQSGKPPKTSRKLANKAALGLHLLVIALDEVHELFQHPTYGKEAADLAIRLIKRGRKYGIVLLLATQSPTKDSIPREVTRNVGCGVAFCVADHVANDGLLGTGKYKAGIRATELRFNVDRGTCVTVGITSNPFELIRAFYIPLEDGRDEVTPVISRAMDGIKELRRTGQPAAIEAAVVDTLRDVYGVLQSPRDELRDVLPRLRDRDGKTYTPWNQAQLIAYLEGEGVAVGTVKGYRVVLAADVEQALAERGGGGDDEDL